MKAAGPRLTGGTARGARLFSLEGRDVRPALARMRTSVFEILGPFLRGARVVDLFAGTGSLGLEALSRGAARTLFLDTDRRCLDVIRRNIEKLRFRDRAEVLRADAFEEAARLGPAEIVFVDPPYAFYEDRAGAMRRLLETLVSSAIAPEGRVVVEHPPRGDPGAVSGGKLVDQRRYGGTAVAFYSRA